LFLFFRSSSVFFYFSGGFGLFRLEPFQPLCRFSQSLLENFMGEAFSLSLCFLLLFWLFALLLSFGFGFGSVFDLPFYYFV